MSNRKVNNNVSTSVVSRAEKVIISELKVVSDFDASNKGARVNKSTVWRYFGALHQSTADGKSIVLDNDRLYCRPCLDREKERYAKNSALAHISRVKNYGKSSTTTLKEHLTNEHKISTQSDEHVEPKLTQSQLTLKRKLEYFEPCTTPYELNRDMVIWGSLDLEPFMFTEKPGIKYFFDKNFPTMSLPSRSTLSRGALYDVHDAVQAKIKEELQSLKGGAICIMMDGWTDKYKRYPYIGLRVGYVDKQWVYKVVTISLKVLEKHTSLNMSMHIQKELEEYCGLLLNTVQVFTTHDGAANMVKASQLLRSCYFQHCIAHSLHLLLVNDGINKVPQLVDVLQRCKTAVIKLDAKCYIVDHEIAKTKDREVMNSIVQRISMVAELLQADSNISIDSTNYPDSDDGDEAPGHGVREEDSEGLALEGMQYAEPKANKKHHTLKQSCPTRWNSILYMLDSVIDLWTELNEALKFNGDRELCLSQDDKLVLCELQRFLRPFHDLTELVSSEQPHLGLVPLIIREVKDAAKLHPGDSEIIYQLKKAIADRLPYRIKVTETVQIASLLDPSLKPFMSADVPLDDLKRLLVKHTKLVHDRLLRVSAAAATVGTANTAPNPCTSHSQDRETASTSSVTQPLSKKMKMLEKFRPTNSVVDLDNKIENEVNLYLHLEATGADENPLEFWKGQQQNFPLLSLLAKTYLSVSASSVPVEAMFSTSGLILNQKRCSMAPHRANLLTVIHDNYAKFFPITREQAEKKQALAHLAAVKSKD